MFNHKLFIKDIENAKQQGLGLVYQESTNLLAGAQMSESKLRTAN
jgi:hypothetical protein